MSDQWQTQWQDDVDAKGTATREFTLTHEHRRPITGAVWLPEENLNTSILMCFGHGASGDRYQAPICDLAARFLKHGITSLAIDGPVHGLRRVEPGGREALRVELQRPDVFQDMIEDWTVAVTIAQTLPGLENTKLGYFGLSMGSIFGIPFLASRRDVRAAVLGLLGTRDNQFGQTIDQAAGKIHFPLRFIVQLEDELFDRNSCLNLFDQFASDHKTLGANPGQHPEVPADEIDLAFDFLVRQFSGTASRQITHLIAD